VSTQQFDTVGVVLEEATSCTSTTATSKYIWKCASSFHGDNKHYYVRAI
jgi:hypothetical protein